MKFRDEGVCQFYITFAIEPDLNARQRRHNVNELALFYSQTKWTGNELSMNNLNNVHADFVSAKRITVIDHCAQSRVDPDTMKLSLFQNVKDIKFEDICDNDYPQLDIVTLRAISNLRSRMDFSEESIPTDIMLTVINSITLQAITPAEQALGMFTCRKLKNMDILSDCEAGEHKQLNQFHDLQMFGDDIERPLDFFCNTSITLAISCQTRWITQSRTMLPRLKTSSTNTACTCENIFILRRTFYSKKFSHLQPNRISYCLVEMLKMLLHIIQLLKSLHI